MARTSSGDVYAGRDGNVYRNQGGSWQKHDNGNWNSVDRPSPTTRSAGAGTSSSTMGPPASGAGTMDQLNRDSAYRSEGAQRTRDYGSYQRSGSGGSSYRSGGGGGYSGGGGRRGGGGGGRRR